MSRLKGIATLQKLLCAACALLLLLAPVSTAAQMDYDVFCIINDCAYYDPYSCGEEGATQLIGRDNIEKAYNFFISKGLEPHQSAGIVGNLMQESGVNPSSNNPAAQPPATPASTYFPGLTYNGGGIAQWEGERWSGPDGLLAFAQQQGKPWNDLGLQLDFIWKEMPNQYAGDVAALQAILPGASGSTSSLDAVKMSQTAAIAAQAFELTFERAGNPQMQNRINYANQILDPANGMVGNNPSSIAAASCPVGSGQFVDGFQLYDQCDPAWGGKQYGVAGTICQAGCGPSTMAMIITALTGTPVTPDVVAEYAAANGQSFGGGSAWTIPKVTAEHWGLKATFLGNDIVKINEVLMNGGLVAAAGRGGIPFTPGGHYIVIRALTADGQWLIGDSNLVEVTSSRPWDPNDIMAKIIANGSGSVYGVTR
ncbi:C39 family peptidase [Candidatus Saccharibacteria bacterium]|nr:C39 family peptidase [Candidatus Saccharibacteria bacterium]